ncbi:hypothetical protein JIG36_13620 [Actinoplanes sp. LDG1-06]|uniref:Secreted protein n=1 Tax=Paractinoplanes ovalisporus TaxID=2810368 RepID=A0ABS2AB39_9ACTN|nr:hypothetical protein [Actinoplanes ovalisporus]
MSLPLLFLDVDGTLIPFRARWPAAPGATRGSSAVRASHSAQGSHAGSGGSHAGSGGSHAGSGGSHAGSGGSHAGSGGSHAGPGRLGESDAGSGGADASSGNPLLGRLDPDDGRRLLALGCAPVWATTWMAEANEEIAPRLGLPELPVVPWPDEDDVPAPGLHWKTASLVRFAAARPFAWLDDEITDADRRWVSGHHPGPALLRRVDPLEGVTEDDFAAVARWVASVSPPTG